MKVPSVRFYLDEDYEDVKELFDIHGYGPVGPEGLQGTSLVAHDEETGDLVGFVWSLAAEGTKVAYVDHLVISKGLRSSSAGMVMLMSLLSYLKKAGVEEVTAISRPENVALIRMMLKRGAEDRGVFRAMTLQLGTGENGNEAP